MNLLDVVRKVIMKKILFITLLLSIFVNSIRSFDPWDNDPFSEVQDSIETITQSDATTQPITVVKTDKTSPIPTSSTTAPITTPTTSSTSAPITASPAAGVAIGPDLENNPQATNDSQLTSTIQTTTTITETIPDETVNNIAPVPLAKSCQFTLNKKSYSIPLNQAQCNDNNIATSKYNHRTGQCSIILKKPLKALPALKVPQSTCPVINLAKHKAKPGHKHLNWK